MKISNRTHPVLNLISKSEGFNIPNENEGFNIFVKNKLAYLWDRCNENIYVISDNFYQASRKCIDKLMQINEGIDCSDFSGVYVFRGRVYVINVEEKEEEAGKFKEYSIFIFDSSGELIAFLDNEYGDWYIKSFRCDFNEVIEYLLGVHLFKKYAQVLIENVKPNSKVKTIGCKYVNDTRFNLKYLDSKWFTTFIKSDAFKVSGHFRLQPKKKDGEWTKELIWITDFEKLGYTANARINNNSNQNNEEK